MPGERVGSVGDSCVAKALCSIPDRRKNRFRVGAGWPHSVFISVLGFSGRESIYIYIEREREKERERERERFV